MHDIWNPWHGCSKVSEGCKNCYMMYLDKIHNNNFKGVFKTTSFNYPLKKNRDGSYKVKSGELIRVCMNSDFFIEEADSYRDEAWKIIKERSDVKFFLLTKRPERIEKCLPSDWGDGYENVFLNVTTENQKRADERIPILFEIKAKHKGIMIAPILEYVNFKSYLKEGIIEQVICGGENYEGNRPCNFDWIKQIANDIKPHNITFAFIETGTTFIKDNKTYIIKNKAIQAKMAYRSNVSFKGKDINFILKDKNGNDIPKEELYIPKYTSVNCIECGNKIICNGCCNCGKCKQIGDNNETN